MINREGRRVDTLEALFGAPAAIVVAPARSMDGVHRAQRKLIGSPDLFASPVRENSDSPTDGFARAMLAPGCTDYQI